MGLGKRLKYEVGKIYILEIVPSSMHKDRQTDMLLYCSSTTVRQRDTLMGHGSIGF